MAALIARAVTLDVCPTSNRRPASAAADRAAPLPRLIRAGVPVTISTDDRTVSDLTLVDELTGVVQSLGVTPSQLAGTDATGLCGGLPAP